MTREIEPALPSELQSLVATGHARLDASQAIERLWAQDHRLSKPDPTDIANRLGWLTINGIRVLRKALVSHHHVTTTGGYGPRYLHSTGQLHKGGPKSGLFLQLVDQMTPDLSIPGKSFTFRTLAQAHAIGDIQALHAHTQQGIVLPLCKNPIATIQTLTKLLTPRAQVQRPLMRRTKSGRAGKK